MPNRESDSTSNRRVFASRGKPAAQWTLTDVEQLARSADLVMPIAEVLELYQAREQELKSLKELLERSESQHLELLEHSLDAAFIVNFERFRFETVNDKICELFRSSREILMALDPRELSGLRQPDGRTTAECARERVHEVLENGSARFEWNCRALTGREFLAEVTLVRVQSAEGIRLHGSVVDISQRKKSQRRDRNRRHVLEQIARGKGLTSILESIVRLMEQDISHCVCSILLLDAGRTRLLQGAAPHLPQFYNEAIHGLEIGEGVGCCGTAAFTGKRVIVEDIEVHPYWKKFLPLARRANLRSCWSEPILSAGNQVLGTFALYHSTVASPSAQDLELLSEAADLASIAIEHSQMNQERAKYEAQLQHAQKLESLGVLAGGIAHDFNNLLTGIMGFAELALIETPVNSRAYRLIQETISGAHRAAELTRQMLAYSGKGRFVIEAVQLSSLIREMEQLLRISISKKCELKFEFEAGMPPVEVDSPQMRQVIMNLVINASEAMGDQSGVILVRTGVVECRKEDLADYYLGAEIQAGRFVYFEVSDTGCGMNAQTLARIFEPFYSTKFTGRGLGLSAVLGIVKGHRGALRVQSEPGKGTTFRMLIPASQTPARLNVAQAATPQSWHGSGLALVVDDEESVADVMRCMLENMGFDVLIAHDGRQALEVFAREHQRVRIVLLDMTMPQLDGAETLRAMRKIQPKVKIVLSSGYNEQTATGGLQEDGPSAFIQKPWSFGELLSTIQKVLS